MMSTIRPWLNLILFAALFLTGFLLFGYTWLVNDKATEIIASSKQLQSTQNAVDLPQEVLEAGQSITEAAFDIGIYSNHMSLLAIGFAGVAIILLSLSHQRYRSLVNANYAPSPRTPPRTHVVIALSLLTLVMAVALLFQIRAARDLDKSLSKATQSIAECYMELAKLELESKSKDKTSQ